VTTLITANDVKATLRSLIRKINKETGREHSTISEGVETLVLGYGRGESEAWDCKIYVNGEIVKDVKDYYEEGRQAGLSEAGRIIYGAFILDAVQTPVVNEVVMLSEPIYVLANFYTENGYVKETIESLTVSPSGELVSIYNFDRTKFIKYLESEGKWICGHDGITEDLPDAIGRIIEFTEPVAVAAALFNAFDDISSTNIEDTVVSMVDQRLINVSEEGF
jgi:hypothetical protein